jgi:dihydroflavonol-4-reductase
MNRILVTGANGHLGANIVRSLLQKGYQVVPFVRRNADLRGLAGLNLTYCYGDVLDPASLLAACQGCDAVIHTAAVYTFRPRNVAEVTQAAVVGTRNMLTAAKAAGVRRLVYTSSTGAIGYSASPTDIRTEADWHDDAHVPYYAAKVESEREACRLAEELGVPTVRLCPSTIVGPYDYRITPSTRVILDLIHNGNTYEGGSNIVDVRDVAETHIAALQLGEPGCRYAVGGANLHSVELGAIVSAYTGTKLRKLPKARWLVLPMGRLLEVAAKVTGSESLFTYGEAYEHLQRYGYYDSSLARHTFGITPRDAHETLRDCIRWLLHLNQIKITIPPHLLEPLTVNSQPVTVDC